MFPPRRGLRVNSVVAFVVCLSLAMVGVIAVADLALAAPRHRHHVMRLLASDNMHRHVTVGLGRAREGGRYAVSALDGARVFGHHAVLGPVQPGRGVSAWLPSVAVRDVRAKTSFRLAHHDRVGNGQYFDIGLRRVTGGTEYLAKIRLIPGAGAFASFSRMVDGHETMLGGQRRVLRPSALRGWIDVQAQAVGNYPVVLSMRVWRAGHPRPTTFQLNQQDSSAERIVRTGSVSFMSYLSSHGSGSTTTWFRGLRVWRNHQRSLSGGGGGQPTSTAPTSSAPTSGDPTSGDPTSSAPTSSAPTSGAPTSTAPTSSAPTSTAPTSSAPTSSAPTSSAPTSGAPGGGSGTAADAGSAPLGSTSYPIPSGAIFVSPNGSDSASGSQANPVQTLARAISIAPSGGTIVMRAGSYNESVQDYNKPLTIQSYPGETVWLDGSTAVSGWTQQGSTWVHTGWTPQFNNYPSDSGSVSNAPGWSFVNSAHPMAAWPDQVWINGAELNQVGSAAQVSSGDFYVDYDSDELVIGDNPTSQNVRASNLSTAFTTYADDVTLRGIGVRDYATSLNQFGAVRLLGPNPTAQNDVFSQNATTGLFVRNNGATLDHLTASQNGLLGIRGYHVNGILVENTLSEGNNAQQFNMSPVAGGMKIDSSRGVTIVDNQFVHNLGPGDWCDSSTYNATIVGNIMADNAGHGLSYEISSTALIADNLVENNGGDGMKINDSDHVRVWNNTIIGNGRDIEVVEDLRRGSNLSVPGHNSQVAQPDPTEPWTITNDSIMNNVLSPASGSYQLYVMDYSKQYTADDINLQVNGNQFLNGTSAPMVVWGQGTSNPELFTSVNGFIATTGQGSSNVGVSTSQAGSGGVPLPADVAAAVDQPTGTTWIGAF